MHLPSPIVRTRLFHASASRQHLVAPPHPVSNMRPVIYEDAPPDPQPPALLPHPYSLFEFSSTTCNDQASSLELQFRLQRQQLDAFHHKFWLDVSPLPPRHTIPYHLGLRAILVSKPLKMLSFYPFRNRPQPYTKRVLYLNSINNGICKRKTPQMLIPLNGVVVIGRSFFSNFAFGIRDLHHVLAVSCLLQQQNNNASKTIKTILSD